MQQVIAIPRVRFVLNLAGSLSLTAALIHALVMPEHFEEWWGYGMFFLVVALAQAAYGIALVLNAWGTRPVWFSGIGRAQQQAFYVLGIIGNAAIIVLYLITRTSGIPIGPHAGEIESFTTISVVSTLLEIALVGCLLFLLADTSPQTQR